MSKVIDLSLARLKNQARQDLDNGRTPLYISHSKGIVTTGEQILKQDNLVDKVARIRHSLDRINELMVELRKLNNK